MSTDHISKSKFLSYVLRHRPESIGLHLDSEGWANIQELLTCASKHGRRFDATVLKEVKHFQSGQMLFRSLPQTIKEGMLFLKME